ESTATDWKPTRPETASAQSSAKMLWRANLKSNDLDLGRSGLAEGPLRRRRRWRAISTITSWEQEQQPGHWWPWLGSVRVSSAWFADALDRSSDSRFADPIPGRGLGRT